MEADPSTWPITPCKDIHVKPSDDVELRIKDPRVVEIPTHRSLKLDNVASS